MVVKNITLGACGPKHRVCALLVVLYSNDPVGEGLYTMEGQRSEAPTSVKVLKDLIGAT